MTPRPVKIMVDETHRADLVSWVESAQARDTDFPIQNLPLGCFRTAGRAARPGIAIGDSIAERSWTGIQHSAK